MLKNALVEKWLWRFTTNNNIFFLDRKVVMVESFFGFLTLFKVIGGYDNKLI